jgi:hypothetical protein
MVLPMSQEGHRKYHAQCEHECEHVACTSLPEVSLTFTEQVTLLVGQATPKNMYYMEGIGVLDPRVYAGSTGPGTQVYTEGKVRLVSEPAQLLPKLYAGASAAERLGFIPLLMSLLNEVNARVIARALLVTGNVDGLLEIKKLNSAAEQCWRGVIHVLRFESGLLRDEDLAAIDVAAHVLRHNAFKEGAKEPAKIAPKGFKTYGSPLPDVVRTFSPMVDEVESVIARVRYQRLAKALRSGTNLAVDADRQVLLSRLATVGYSAALSNASNEIEHKAATAQTERQLDEDVQRRAHEIADGIR